MKHVRQNSRGFTLLELMIVVAIVGIIAAIAFPSYQQSVMRANRTDAKAFLSEVASKQEAFFADRRRYADSLDDLGYVAALCYAGGDNTFGCGTSVATATYSMTISAFAPPANPTSYTVTATAVGRQTGDKCGNFSLNSAGNKTVTGTATDCW